MIRFTCPRCQATLKAEDHQTGAKFNCPACGQRLQVPLLPPPNRTVLGKPLPAGPPQEVPAPPAAGPEPEPQTREVPCTKCTAVLTVRPAQFGRRVRCTRCDTKVQVPRFGRPAARPRALEVDPPRGAPRGRPRRRPAKSDGLGLTSLILGVVAVACLPLGCLACGATYLVAIPVALAGAALGFFASGGLKVAGLVLNFAALAPAIVLALLFLLGAGLGAVAPGGPGALEAAVDLRAGAFDRIAVSNVKADKNEQTLQLDLEFYKGGWRLSKVSGLCKVRLYASQLTDFRTADKDKLVAEWDVRLTPEQARFGRYTFKGRYGNPFGPVELVSSWGVAHAEAGGVSSNWEGGFFFK
jgi:DNA-directed RNA polymerase subunit RPC12/RpoP